MSALFTPPPTPHDPLARPRYRADIDGLRAIAVLSVVAFHAFPDWVHGGYVGVDVFFVISGFLISSILFESLEEGRFSFATFYSRRIRRIFAALILVLVFCYAFGWFLLVAGDFRELGKQIAGGAGFVSNLVLWSGAGYFDPGAEWNPLLHLWSLGIEEQFYFLWPLLLYLAWKRRFSWFALLLALLGASFAVDVVEVRTNTVASFYSPFARFWELSMGSLLAWLTVHGRDILQRHRDLGAAAGLALIAIGIAMLTPQSAFPGWWALLPTLGAFLVIASGAGSWVNRNVLASRVLVWVGLISYPLYLWHWPVLTLTRILEYGAPSRLERVGAVAASIALAALTYTLIEKPIRSGGHNRVKVTALCTLLAGVFALGGYAWYAGGFVSRSINRDARAQFVYGYEEMLKGMGKEYRAACDFYDWQTHGQRASIDADCVMPGARATYFLWGDSHAQALSSGIRSLLPEGVRLAQVATSGCKPHLGEVTVPTPGNACNASNRFAREQIARLKPDVVILAQVDRHSETNWEAIADFIHAAGGKEVVLVGPLPEWHPSLPLVVARDYWGSQHLRVKSGVDPAILAADRALADEYDDSEKLAYVSLVSRLCDASGCLATVPGDARETLMAADYGHLTVAASAFVASRFLKPYLPRRLADKRAR